MNVPIDFHEENFKLKDWDKEKLKEVFAELEFKTLGKRILGEDFTAFKTAPEGVQTDLFGNIIEDDKKEVKSQKSEAGNDDPSQSVSSGNGDGLNGVVDKNINNTPHKYEAIEGDAAIKKIGS